MAADPRFRPHTGVRAFKVGVLSRMLITSTSVILAKMESILDRTARHFCMVGWMVPSTTMMLSLHWSSCFSRSCYGFPLTASFNALPPHESKSLWGNRWPTRRFANAIVPFGVAAACVSVTINYATPAPCGRTFI